MGAVVWSWEDNRVHSQWYEAFLGGYLKDLD